MKLSSKNVVLYSIYCLILFTSCATTQYTKYTHNLPQDPTTARIYVVRPSILAYAIPMKVSLDDKIVGKTGAKGFICYDVPISSNKTQNLDGCIHA
jgi:hypothetical protein